MDLLRFRNFTLGHLWVREYGDIEDQDELQHILSYSPLHNITAPTSNSPQYPAVFVTTSDHDDRYAHNIILQKNTYILHSFLLFMSCFLKQI